MHPPSLQCTCVLGEVADPVSQAKESQRQGDRRGKKTHASRGFLVTGHQAI